MLHQKMQSYYDSFSYQNFTNFNNRSAFDKALGRGKKSQINIGRTFDSDTK